MKRSKHGLSNYKLLTCDMGELVPLSCYEVLPGDTVQQATSLLLRVSPLVAPVMHPVSVRVHHWFVPNRLIWADWEDFITGGPTGTNASAYPRRVGINTVQGSLVDYLGIPPSTSNSFSALPERAYGLIWNEFYRDQDLQTELVVSTASGTDVTTNSALQRCAWEKDYFTAARPWPQKGATVTLPLGTRAPVRGIGIDTTAIYGGPSAAVNETDGTGSVNYTSYAQQGQFSDVLYQEDPDNTGFPNIWADLSAASSVNVNDVRRAFALQRYQEARALYGSRYTEYLAYLGVRSKDSRLQRPEYLGGGKSTISFSEVLQTGPYTDAADDDPGGVAQLRGHGISAMRSRRYRRFFEEHGIVLSLLSVRPRTMYMNGMARMWHRSTKEDYWQRELEKIGQQAVRLHEVYNDPTTGPGAATFGYQDRYAEYRHIQSSVAADFRSTLDYWHMARGFGSAPTLNAAFVSCEPTKRIHAVQSEDVLWIMANHSIQARRMVSTNAVGRII